MRNYIKMIQKALHNKAVLFSYASASGILNLLNDTTYLKMMYKVNMGQPLNLDCPKTFNEKLQWLKIHDRNPLYTSLVDKYEVKKYVAARIGEKYIIPTLGIWNHFDEIDFDTLPNRFVLKCTHDSGGIVICKNKRELDKDAAKKLLEKCLKRNYYWYGREWPYKNVKPRIIAEQFLSDDGNTDLKDYKLMCFAGHVKATFVCSNRFSNEGLSVTFFDKEWNRLPFERHYPSEKREIRRPDSYDEMIRLAEILSQGIPFVRVDFYEVKGEPYFGELTFYPGNGMEEFTPPKWDEILGDMIVLPSENLK